MLTFNLSNIEEVWMELYIYRESCPFVDNIVTFILAILRAPIFKPLRMGF